MKSRQAVEHAPGEPRPITLEGSGYRLFPDAICRVAGQPFDSLAAFRSPATLDALACLERAEEGLQGAKEALLERLHAAVGSGCDAPARKALLGASRKLRRRGRLSDQQEEMLRRDGPPAVVSALEAWHRAERSQAEARKRMHEHHRRELEAAGTALLEIVDDRFLQALVLSSPVVYRCYRDTIDSRNPEKTGARRQRARRRLLAALLRYLTRASVKTTPFSTFTWLAAARWRSDGGADRLLALPEAEPVSAPSLNKALYALLTGVLRSAPELFPCLSVSVNPSLTESSRGHVMVLARAGMEEVVRLPPSPAISLAVELIAEHGGSCAYPELVDRLAAAFAVDAERLRPRLHRMIESGILQLNSSIADYELDWAPRLAHSLRASRAPLAGRVRAVLRSLEIEQERFPRAGAEERLRLLERSRRCLDPLFEDPAPAARDSAGDPDLEAGLLAEHQRALGKNMFYEDTYLEAAVEVDLSRLKPAFDSLGRWVDWMHRFSIQWPYHATMRAYFDDRFGDSKGVPFLAFYRGFLDQVFAKILRFERDSSSGEFHQLANPFGGRTLPNALQAAAGLRRLIARRWQENPRAEAIAFDGADLEAVKLCPSPRDGLSSASLFVQLLPRGSVFEKDRLLVDQQAIHAGMGRYFSRFLHRLDAGITERLRAGNDRLDVLVAELCDDGAFSFNANLHPRLTEWEINYPAGLTGSDGATNLAISDLEVRPGQDPSRLDLVHRPSGKVVFPVDLGFVNPLRRPPLFRVLALFSPSVFHRIYLPWSFDGSTSPSAGEPEVIYRPRVVFEDRVVLSRRSWLVPAASLRRVLEGRSAAEAFRSLRQWQQQHGLPEQVFFHVPRAGVPRPSEMVAPREGGDEAPGENPQAAGREAAKRTHKPQFISFDSVLLSELLIDVVSGHRGFLAFEEMLPSAAMLARRRGRPHATELIIQLDREARSCG